MKEADVRGGIIIVPEIRSNIVSIDADQISLLHLRSSSAGDDGSDTHLIPNPLELDFTSQSIDTGATKRQPLALDATSYQLTPRITLFCRC